MRTRLKTLACASALALCAVSSASAESFYWSWTGFYVGADAGFVSNRSLTTTQASAGSYFTPGPVGQLAVFNAIAPDTVSARGFDAAVHAGFNWQLRPFVVGIEAEYGAFRTRAVRDTAFIASGVQSQLHNEVSVDWLSTARIRLGVGYSVWLFYLTGGAAVTGLKASSSYVDSAVGQPNGAVAVSQTTLGWTIGAGVEIAIAPGWTVRGEYLHLDFPSVNGTGRITNPATGAFNPTAFNADLRSDMVRLGVSYKFAWYTREVAPVVVTSKY